MKRIWGNSEYQLPSVLSNLLAGHEIRKPSLEVTLIILAQRNWQNELRFNVALDTKSAILKMHFRANLFASTEID